MLPGGPADITLRLMHEADLPAYKRLRDAMLARHPEAFTSDADTELRRSADSYGSRLTGGAGGACLFTLTAWRGDRLVGAITCEREPRLKVRHLVHIVGMMVADGLHGRGIGQALLLQALRLLRGDASLQQALLTVTACNAPAVRLYERCGFVRYGRLEGAIALPDGQLLDKDLMRLALR